MPRGIATPNCCKSSFAWYSCRFMRITSPFFSEVAIIPRIVSLFTRAVKAFQPTRPNTGSVTISVTIYRCHPRYKKPIALSAP